MADEEKEKGLANKVANGLEKVIFGGLNKVVDLALWLVEKTVTFAVKSAVRLLLLPFQLIGKAGKAIRNAIDKRRNKGKTDPTKESEEPEKEEAEKDKTKEKVEEKEKSKDLNTQKVTEKNIEKNQEKKVEQAVKQESKEVAKNPKTQEKTEVEMTNIKPEEKNKGKIIPLAPNGAPKGYNDPLGEISKNFPPDFLTKDMKANIEHLKKGYEDSIASLNKSAKETGHCKGSPETFANIAAYNKMMNMIDKKDYFGLENLDQPDLQGAKDLQASQKNCKELQNRASIAGGPESFQRTFFNRAQLNELNRQVDRNFDAALKKMNGKDGDKAVKERNDFINSYNKARQEEATNPDATKNIKYPQKGEKFAGGVFILKGEKGMHKAPGVSNEKFKESKELKKEDIKKEKAKAALEKEQKEKKKSSTKKMDNPSVGGPHK